MSGIKWQNLMSAFQTAIQTIRKIPEAEKYIKISILIEGSNCIVFQKNVTPNAVNLIINPRYGGNNFLDTFNKAYGLMN